MRWWVGLGLVVSLAPARAEAARDADGWLFLAGVRAGLTTGWVRAATADRAFEQVVFGVGPQIDLGLGHAVTQDVALALEATLGMELFVAKAGTLPHSGLSGVAWIGGALVAHGTPVRGEPFGWFTGAGFRYAGFAGGQNDIASPDNIVSFGPFVGPAAFAGVDWGFDLGIPWDFAVRVDGAYLREARTTTFVPITASARLSAFVF